ncbi:MAG: hypothetical protein V1797_07225 [Pseudomonadota bacterium]
MTAKLGWLCLLLVMLGLAYGCAKWPGNYNPTAAEEQRAQHEMEWNLDPTR